MANTGQSGTPHDRLIRKLRSIGELSPLEASALRQLPIEIAHIADGEDVVRDGEHPTRSCLLISGFVARYKLVEDGKRQILAFHIPGDIPDAQALHVKRMDHSMAALINSTVGFIPHKAIYELIGKFFNIGALFWRDTLIDAAIFRQWMVGLGRRNAHQRIAHLVCEMYARAHAVDLNDNHRYPFPVTQAELADATGLTVVHVNRVLRGLREDGLLRMYQAGVDILDWDRLVTLAGFDPTYLQLNRSG